MNRYAAEGIARDAHAGRRILVVTRDHREARNAFDEIAKLTHDTKRIHRANGAERIDHHNGGRVTFTTPRSHNARGLTLDAIYLDTGVDPTPDYLAELVPCMSASPNAELIRA